MCIYCICGFFGGKLCIYDNFLNINFTILRREKRQVHPFSNNDNSIFTTIHGDSNSRMRHANRTRARSGSSVVERCLFETR